MEDYFDNFSERGFYTDKKGEVELIQERQEAALSLLPVLDAICTFSQTKSLTLIELLGGKFASSVSHISEPLDFDQISAQFQETEGHWSMQSRALIEHLKKYAAYKTLLVVQEGYPELVQCYEKVKAYDQVCDRQAIANQLELLIEARHLPGRGVCRL